MEGSELHRVSTWDTPMGQGIYYALTKPNWLDSEHVIYYSPEDHWSIVITNPFTQKVNIWDNTVPDPLHMMLSPDRTRAISDGKLYDFDNVRTDSNSAFVS